MSLVDTIERERSNFENHIAREHIGHFARKMFPEIVFKDFHKVYYKIVDMFAKGLISKLIITIPPQNGKSELSSRLLPAYLLGLNPNLRISIGSYSTTFAQDFNRDIQRYIDSDVYKELFPETRLNSSQVVTVSTSYLRNSHVFEIVNKKGSLRAVGRGGPLTGKPVDIMIMDDVYKDAEEANSPVIRESAWNWYTKVVKKRLRNSSQELIVFTRWHEEDLIGKLESLGEVIEVKTWKELENAPKDKFVKINFEALKESEPTEFDPREKGEALWPEEFSLQLLEENRRLDPEGFECLNQGNPSSKEGLLYGEFKTYDEMPKMILGKTNCTDTADMGVDYLCSINYNEVRVKREDDEKTRKYLYVTDIIFNQDPMEKTEPQVSLMLDGGLTRTAHIESNNGGRGFARNVKKLIKGNCKVQWYHQSKNKESRIVTNKSTVMDRIIMPIGWKSKFPEAEKVLRTYKRLFKANKTHDISDTLTAMIEKSIVLKSGSGVRRKN